VSPEAGIQNFRRDWGVILARGDSQRMGQPKGLCRAEDDHRPFLQRIHDLYAGLGWPLAVVTQPELREVYSFLLRWQQIRWILRERGLGTAASVGAALLVLRGMATHLWLHPVDLPAVRPATLAHLGAISSRYPEAVLVPVHEQRPGHPVVLPTLTMGRLADPGLPGSMRAQLRRWCGEGPGRLAPLHHIAVEDIGVITDHDEPESLAAAP